jgi:hypothetical protein
MYKDIFHSMLSRLTILILALAILSAPALADDDRAPFSGYGVFIQGVECVLFQATTGGLYITDLDCPVGESAFIVGEVYDCFSICMQGDGCLEVETIIGCTVAEERPTWGALKTFYHRR